LLIEDIGMDIESIAFKWIANLGLSATVAAASGFATFQFLGKKWLDARFAERLEKFKHDQNQEIERLRYRINALMDRTAKLHQHEFEVLPEVWDKLGIAFTATANFTSRLTSYPDLDRMGEAQYSEFLTTSRLLDWQKDDLRQGGDRNRRYQKMIFWHRLHEVKISHADFHNYFISKGIFIQPDLKEKVRALSNMMYDAFRERELDQETPMPGEGRFAKGDHLQREGIGALQAIEKEVQARLWEANKLE
jgi:hypothetical protein